MQQRPFYPHYSKRRRFVKCDRAAIFSRSPGRSSFGARVGGFFAARKGNNMDFGIASVAGITVICYLVGLIVKATPFNNDKYIPIACGLTGAALGAAALFAGVPDFPAADYLTAVAVGITSGLAATGINQVTKQIVKG